jgi:hypothetical protein
MSVLESRLRSAFVAAMCAASLLLSAQVVSASADTTYTPLPITIGPDPVFPCGPDTVALKAVNSCWPCFEILSFTWPAGAPIRLEVRQRSSADCATTQCQLQSRRVGLGTLAPGHYAVLVDVVWHLPPDSVGSGGDTRTYQQRVEFDVRRCDQSTLPFIEHVFIGGPAPCDSCPPQACPDRPVLVGAQGHLPNNCWTLGSFEVLPLASPSNRPVVRLTVRPPNPLSEMVCLDYPVPFSVGTSLPPQLPGMHELEMQVAVKGWEDSSSLQISSKVFPYAVMDSCPPPPPPPTACVWPFLEPARVAVGDSTLHVRCDLRLMSGEQGSLVFAARADGVPLAGLQGAISASPFLKVVNLSAAGAAAGMQLNWTHHENGASFVLFSGHGAPIPAGQWVPVLRVTVEADSAFHGVAEGVVHGEIASGADSNGTTVPRCVIMTLDLVEVSAHVCVGEPPSCDANRDGLTNVADLVRMVRCILHPESCPDSIAASPDCTGDGTFHLDDVFCCARAILGAPNGTPGRDPGALSFSFGEPVMEGGLLRVPLRVHGAGDLGGALLRLEYPSDRWIAVDPAVAGGDALRAGTVADWTPLLEVGADDVLVGLLRLDANAPADLTVNLAFSLRPGAVPGGELRVGSSDVTAYDGAPLDVNLASLSASLGGSPPASVTRVELSAARPNPSTGATSFVVSLPAAGDVDLAMYDLAGRRVATLWRGSLAAGSRAFTWDPGNVASGVYFARLIVNGEVRSSRVTLTTTK